MNKRYLHHLLGRIRSVSQWIFIALFLASTLLAVLALRHNNLEMIRLRQLVIQADEKKADINPPLNDLREYVHGHMNTDLTSGNNAIRPPIQLKHTYDRLVSAERQRVTTANKKITDTAVRLCEQRFPAGQLRNGRVQCVSKYLTDHGVKEQVIPKELYQFDFVSPLWSADLAGWSVLASMFFLFLAVLRFGVERWLRYQLKS